MGLFDVLKSGANAVMDSVAKKQEAINRYKARLESEDDDSLKRIFKNSSGEKKLAAGILLRERGYGNND